MGEITEVFCILISSSVKWEYRLSISDSFNVTRTETGVTRVLTGKFNGAPCQGAEDTPSPAWLLLPHHGLLLVRLICKKGL